MPKTDIFSTWFDTEDVPQGRDRIKYLLELEHQREPIWFELLTRVRSHYLEPTTLAAYCKELGYEEAAQALSVLIPKGKTSRSGDLGEILGAEYINETLPTRVYVKRLRNKDERETALRGDDLIGVDLTEDNRLHILKGESKSNQALSTKTLLEAETKLLENSGRPSQHSAGVIANMLIREKPRLGIAFSQFNLRKREADEIVHMIVGLTQSKPRTIYPAYLKRPYLANIRRVMIALVIKKHKNTIEALFNDLVKPENIAKGSS